MAVAVTRPGVTVETSFRATPNIVAPSPTIGAQVMATKKGPTTRPVLCTSFSVFEDIFGGFYRGFVGPIHAREFFDNGGASLWVQRVIEPVAVASADVDPTYDAVAGDDLALTAAFGGAEGNNLRFGTEVGGGTVSVSSAGSTTKVTANVLSGLLHDLNSGVSPADSIRLVRKVAGAGAIDTIAFTDTPTTLAISGPATDPVVEIDMTPSNTVNPTSGTSDMDIDRNLDSHLPMGATFEVTTGASVPGGNAITITGDGVTAPMVILVDVDPAAVAIGTGPVATNLELALNSNATFSTYFTAVPGAGPVGDLVDTAIGPIALNPSYSIQDVVDLINADVTINPNLEASVVVPSSGVSPAGFMADTALIATTIPDAAITNTALAALINGDDAVDDLMAATVLQNGSGLVNRFISADALSGGAGAEIAFRFLKDFSDEDTLLVSAANGGEWGNGVGIWPTKNLTPPTVGAYKAAGPATALQIGNISNVEIGDLVRITEETPKLEVTLVPTGTTGTIRVVSKTLGQAITVVVNVTPGAGGLTTDYTPATKIATVTAAAGGSTAADVATALNGEFGADAFAEVVVAGTFTNTGPSPETFVTTVGSSQNTVDLFVSGLDTSTTPDTIEFASRTIPVDGIAIGATVLSCSQHRVKAVTLTAIANGDTEVELGGVGGQPLSAEASRALKIGRIFTVLDGTSELHVEATSVSGTKIGFAGVTLGSTIPAGAEIVSQEFVLWVTDSNFTPGSAPVETHEYLSMSANLPGDYVNARLSGISNQSSRIQAFDQSASTDVESRIPLATSARLLLRRGQDGAFPSDTDHVTALTKLNTVQDITTVAIPGITTVAAQRGVAAYGRDRVRPSLSVLGTPLAIDTILEAANYRNVDLGIDESQAALYWPAGRIADLEVGNGSILEVSAEGGVQGVMSRVAATRGLHKAPANEAMATWLGTVADAQAVDYDSAQDILNPLGVNVIRPIAGRGVRIMGARTLSTVQDGSHYVHKRLIVNFVAAAVQDGTFFAVFEPSSPELGRRLVSAISDFLLGLWQAGWLQGENASDAFFVKSDEENNPPSVTASGVRIIDVAIKPVDTAEFIVVRLNAVSGGVSVTEISAAA